MLTQVESLTPRKSSLGRAENISESGLLIITPETFDRDTEITIRFNLPPIPPGHPIEGKGVVVRVQPGVSMGIRFQQVRKKNRKAIEKFVRQAFEGVGQDEGDQG